MRVPVVALLVWSAACASHHATPGVSPARPAEREGGADLARAGARMLDGCYACLAEARAIYERAAAGPERAQALAGLFEVDILLALRDAELALPRDADLARAAAVGRELRDPSWAGAMVAIARAMPPDAAGTPRSVRVTFHLPQAIDRVEAWQMTLRQPPGSMAFRSYLTIALTCGADDLGVPREFRPPRPTTQAVAGMPALVRYRAAICVPVATASLDRVAADVPAFVEAGAFWSRAERPRPTGAEVARMRVLLAAAAPLKSPAVSITAGALNRALEEWPEALEAYDAVVAAEPAHEDALLGRVVALSGLGERERAIDAATAVIALQNDTIGEAYYWRARNRHALGHLALARADIDAAKEWQVNSRVHTLAAMIEYDQDDVEPAAADAREALRFDPAECTARWYLGLTQIKEADWAPAGETFGLSVDCFRDLAGSLEQDLAALRTGDVDPAYRVRKLASLETSRQDAAGHVSASPYFAAEEYVNAREIPKALPFLAIAEQNPQLRDKVQALRKLIKK